LPQHRSRSGICIKQHKGSKHRIHVN
jgi:hypothetical protein